MWPESRDDVWVEHLAPEACFDLLSAGAIGRIAVLIDSAPEVYPVNYTVVAGSVVFRTDDGNKLRGIERSPTVCFEVDEIDPRTRTGWSVLVKGRARELWQPEELAAVRDVTLAVWGLGPMTHWVEVAPTEVTGRRLNRG